MEKPVMSAETLAKITKWIEDENNWMREAIASLNTGLTQIVQHLPKLPDSDLWHYTSTSGLKGILLSRNIHCTHAKYLNDPLEIQHAIDVMRRTEAKLVATGTISPDTKEVLSGAFDSGVKDTYIACFSAAADMLSQWRAFSEDGAGYSIVFSPNYGDVNAPLTSTDTGTSSKWFSIAYDDMQKERIARLFLELLNLEVSKLMAKAEGPSTGPMATNRKSRLAPLLRVNAGGTFRRYLALFKRSFFHEEKEVRLVVANMRKALFVDADGASGFKAGAAGALIPFVEAPLLDKDFKNLKKNCNWARQRLLSEGKGRALAAG